MCVSLKHVVSEAPAVLITTQVFPPEIHPTAVMAKELASGLASRGLRVTVAAGLPHHPTGRVPDRYRHLWRAEEEGGFRVLRMWHPTAENRKISIRAAVMASQMASTALSAAFTGPYDVVLSFGGPPLVGPVLSGLLAGKWRAALVTVIHDLYPDVAVEAGAVNNRYVLGAAREAERLQYRLSDRLVVLGESTRDTLVRDRGIAPAKISVIPVWLDPEEIVPAPRDNEWRRSQGIAPERFVVLYSGTAGIVSGAEILAKVARRVDPDVDVLLVGGGTAWQALQRLAAKGELPPNLRLLAYQPRDQLKWVQASADLSLLTLLPGRGRNSVPSKLQGYMAAGRPVLAAVDDDCDSARLIRRGDFGVVVAPEDAAAIARAINDMRHDRQRLASWGARARRVFEEENTRGPIVDRYVHLLREAASAR